MQRDIRSEPRYAAVLEYFRCAHEPGVGRFHDALDAAGSPDGARLAFTGVLLDAFGGVPATRIGIAATANGALLAATAGPQNDRLPRWSPDGTVLAFLSDRSESGTFQLYVADPGRLDSARLAVTVEGVVESFAWSAGGTRVLLQSAGFGADLAGIQGSGTHAAGSDGLPSWAPLVEEAVSAQQWRRLWSWRVGESEARRIGPNELNVWEAAWCGPDAVVAVVSDGPREGAWYAARVERIDADDGTHRTLFAPRVDQVALPAASPSGERVALVTACCSDRAIVAGDVLLVDVPSGAVRALDTGGVDVTRLFWRDETTLFYIGLRGFETVAGHVDATDGTRRELWSTRESSGAAYPDAAPLPGDAFAIVLAAYDRAPALATVERGAARVIRDFAHAGTDYVRAGGGRFEELTWSGRDGLAIHGYLVCPPGPGPHPLVVLVHGGPVWAFRNTWSMSYAFTPFLVRHGYAVLHPNPRGSGGRGQEFARRVRGDMCGEDAHDVLTGVEALIERGIADRTRIATTGRSYGGYLSAWLVTQTDLFAAAIPMAPVTDNYSQHFTSNIPEFDALFLDASPGDSGGRFFSRSPVLAARNASTPTLCVAGALDRCTPPTQALEFHRALVEYGVCSELVVYPEAGHHIDRLEAQVDLCTRMLTWLERYLPPSASA